MCSAIQPAPGDPTCVHKAAKPRLIPVCTRSWSSFEHFFPNRPYFGGIFGKKCSKVASAVRGRRQTRPLGLPVCVCCVNCHDLVCLYRQRSVIFSLADFACKQSVNTYIAGWSSLVARRAHNPEVVGSNPSPATHAQIAQLVEQRTENPRVTGSIPVLGIWDISSVGRALDF